MQLNSLQLEKISRDLYSGKLTKALARALPDFAELSAAAKAEFAASCIDEAGLHGLKTEQGIASYALLAWFLQPGFDALSKNLPLLLASGYPEVRKVHAMNEWAHKLIMNRQDQSGADEALVLAFRSTSAWGAQR